MKPMSAAFTGESIYVSLSELARAAFPAISAKLELGAWLVLNRDAMQEIEGGSIVEYDMRWDDLPGTNIKTPFGALGILESYSDKTSLYDSKFNLNGRIFIYCRYKLTRSV